MTDTMEAEQCAENTADIPNWVFICLFVVCAVVVCVVIVFTAAKFSLILTY